MKIKREAMRAARTACGMTQGDLARRIGVSPGRIGQIESTGTAPVERIVEIARALGIPARMLTEVDDDKA